MANTTVAFGAVLVLVGLVGFFGTGAAHPTALIPAGFGLVLAICGLLARDPAKRKHAMHAAAAVGLLGLLGSVSGIAKVIRLMNGEAIARPQAAEAQAVMAVLLLVFVGLCVRSFVEARRARVA